MDCTWDAWNAWSTCPTCYKVSGEDYTNVRVVSTSRRRLLKAMDAAEKGTRSMSDVCKHGSSKACIFRCVHLYIQLIILFMKFKLFLLMIPTND